MDENWTIITAGQLKAIAHGAVIDKAQTVATSDVDPIPEALEEGVSRVRRAVSVGNKLDSDKNKVPRSLKGVALRIALYALCERIRFPLTDDQKTTKENDISDLKRISDKPMRVEAPDNPEPDGKSIQSQPRPRVETKERNFTNRSMDGI